MTEVLDILADVPPTLAAAWAVWFGAGVLLMIWYRRARLNVDDQPTVAARTVARAKSAPRTQARPSAGSFPEPRSTTSDLELSFDAMPSESASAYARENAGELRRDRAGAASGREGGSDSYGTPTAYTPPAPRMAPVAPAAPRPKPAPVVVGDPFGDLATLLDQPGAPAAPAAPAHRTPGDSPILNSAGSPILRD